MKFTYLYIFLLSLTACSKDIPECLDGFDSFSFSGTTIFNDIEWATGGVHVYTENGDLGVWLFNCVDFPSANSIYIFNLFLNDSLDFNEQTNSALMPTVHVGHSDASRVACSMVLDTLVSGYVRFVKLDETQYHLVLNCDVRPDFNFVGWCDEIAKGEDTVRMELDLIITRN